MICTVLQDKDFDGLLSAMDGCGMAEIRLDRCDVAENEIDELFSTADIPLVATCRIAEMARKHPEMSAVAVASLCEKRLVAAIKAGAAYADLEIEFPKENLKRVKSVCEDNGTLLIRSFHDFRGTDSTEALKAVVEKCVYHGADIVKIAATANSPEDAARVLALYDDPSCLAPPQTGRHAAPAPETAEGRLIAFCMGEAGRASRMECLRKGAPFTYVALTEADVTAPGQMTADEMAEKLYGGLPFFDADIMAPSSKSFVQRAVVAAALAGGVSRLRNYTPCGDSESAIKAAETLGAKVERETAGDETNLVITGIAASEGCLPTLTEIHAGESGLLARLMIPLAAELSAGRSVKITGEKTLANRRLPGVNELMTGLGVKVSSSSEKLPVSVEGRLSVPNAEVSGENGSQLISGLLMAMPLTDRNMTLLVEKPKSIPYTFMTAEVLKRFGVKISNEMLGGRDFLESDGDWSLCTEMIFKVRAGQKYEAADIDIEGDWSAAVPFMVAASIFGKACVDGLDTNSLQADIAIMDILMDAGASITQIDGDDGEIHVQRAPLLAFDCDLSHCPDLFPCVGVLAAFCQGRSRICGVSRLRDKESDRAAAVVEMLGGMGVEAWIDESSDALVVTGHSLEWRILNGSMLKGGRFTSRGDHRMVMALKIAALGADSPVEIDDEACVSKSCPDFVKMFDGSVAGSRETSGIISQRRS